MSPSTPNVIVCAAPGCDEPVVRGGRGRPRIYCSPGCRPGRLRQAGSALIVEVDHEPTPDDIRPTGRIWMVRLRRAHHTVVIATQLGRPSADHLAGKITKLLVGGRRAEGGAIE